MKFKGEHIFIFLAFLALFLINYINRDLNRFMDLVKDYRVVEAEEFLDKSSREKKFIKKEIDDSSIIWFHNQIGDYKFLENFYLEKIEKFKELGGEELDYFDPKDDLIRLYLEYEPEKLGAYLDYLDSKEDYLSIFKYYRLTGQDLPSKYLDLLYEKKDYDLVLDYYLEIGDLEAGADLILNEEFNNKDIYNNIVERLGHRNIFKLLRAMEEENMDYSLVLEKLEDLYIKNMKLMEKSMGPSSNLEFLLNLANFYRQEGLDLGIIMENPNIDKVYKKLVGYYLENKLDQVRQVDSLTGDRILLITTKGLDNKFYTFDRDGEVQDFKFYQGEVFNSTKAFDSWLYPLKTSGGYGLISIEYGTCIHLEDDLVRSKTSLASKSLNREIELGKGPSDISFQSGISNNIFLVEKFYLGETTRQIEKIIIREYREEETGRIKLVDLREIEGRSPSVFLQK